MPNSCDRIQPDQPEVTFAHFRSAIADLDTECGGEASVRCLDARPDGRPHVVQFAGNAVRIDGLTWPAAGMTYVFFGDIEVSGTASVETSVASLHPRSGNVSSGGNITVTGEVAGGVGLFAEENVIVETESCSVGRIDGSIVAPFGSLTLDPSLAAGWAQKSQVDRAGLCNEIVLEGTTIVRDAPRLSLEFTDGTMVGYKKRTYSLTGDDGTPPPSFPLSASWRFESMRPANPDCLGLRRGDRQCR
jgi:hypothetical protein